MSVIPGQEVPGRWLPFNGVIILTIVWFDNHAHYRERRRKRKEVGNLSGCLCEATRDGERERERRVVTLIQSLHSTTDLVIK